MGRVPLQVIAGDFNEVPDGPAIRQMKQTYRSALSEVRGYEPLATFPTTLTPRTDDWSGCIDYIFVSSGISVGQAGIFANKPRQDDPTLYASDHVGLVATLQIEGRSAARLSSQERV